MEKLAGSGAGDAGAIARDTADSVESDVQSVATLIKRLYAEQLNHQDVQSVFAHLFDDIIGAVFESAKLAGEAGGEELHEALMDYMEEAEKRLNRKGGKVWAPDLTTLLENFWADMDLDGDTRPEGGWEDDTSSDDEEEEENEQDAADLEEEERAEARSRRAFEKARTDVKAKPPRPARAPKTAEMEGEVEIEDEE
jgi:ketosteroid isomerase-like protein